MSICAECSKLQKTCCERAGVIVALTDGDIKRIAEFAGCDNFYELKAVEEEYKDIYVNPDNMSDGDRIYVKYLFDSEGRRNVLKKKEDEECCFLSKTGCMLPYDTRPIICRVYPYDWNDDCEVKVEGYLCPAGLFSDDDDLVKKLGLSVPKAVQLVKMFYDEICPPNHHRL